MSARDAEYHTQLTQLVSGALGMLDQGMTTPEAVQARGTTGPEAAGGRASVGPWHAAAAVLSTFDSSTLKPAPGVAAGSGHDDIITLLADSTPILGSQGNNRWKLLVDVRREILRVLGGREKIQEALDANPERPQDDPAQGIFEACVHGSAPPLDEQDITQVAATFEVAQWLQDLDVLPGAQVPDLDAIRGRNDYLTLLQPFEKLAGTNFAGRTKELQELRDYVGVLPPGSLRERVTRAARKVFRLQEKPPFVIYGPGGIGKSALVARFIWEHTTSHESRFPFVYLDFDRGSLRAEEPLTLLMEAVRQIGLQYEETRVFADRVRSAWQSELSSLSVDPVAPEASQSVASVEASIGWSAQSDWQRYLRDFASLLKNVRDGSDPCLFVLDTFEEAQNRGDVVVSSLCEFFEIFQEAVPRLRIVVVGRIPLAVDGFPTDPRPLGDFDEAAAQLFLEKRGIQSPDLRRTIIKRIGRSPLSLLLAATAVQRAQKSGETEDLKLTGTRGAQLSESQIQGYLYRRILNHIQDEEVCRLAYPGLVLRRVTPDIIQKVLASPCNVSVPNEAAAQDLFDRLASEVTLVQFEEGALVHRRDVRRIMLPLLRDSSEGHTIREIEDAAIRYYQDLDGSVERAEEIYHRLSRHQPFGVIAERWTDDVRPLLFSALDPSELGARERAWLLPRLNPNLRLDDEERAAADLETWEWDTEHKVRELLARNRLTAALSVLRARPERTLGSPLYKAEAGILQRMKRWGEARQVLETGAESAGEKGNTGLVIDLLLQAAGLDLGLADLTAAEHKLDCTAELLQGRRDPSRMLRLALLRFELAARRASHDVPGDFAGILQAFDAMSDDKLRKEPGLAAWTSALLATSDARVVRRVIGLVGLPMRPGQSRSLARAIALWDDAASRSVNRWKGSLGGADLPWAETLTQAWTQLLRDASPMTVGQRVATLLERPDPPPDVLAAVEAIMAEQATPLVPRMDPVISSADQELPRTPQQDARPPGDISLKLTATDARQLCDALLGAFTERFSLVSMIDYRLGRSLDAISLTDDLRTTVDKLCQASMAEGWTASLLAAAIESRPDNAALLRFAERFGLAAKAPELESLARLGSNGPSFNIDVWRARLGSLEAQVCRVQTNVGGTMQYSTGFLIGPDLVLTSYHAVSAAIEGGEQSPAISLLFDFKKLASGETVHPGTVFLPEKHWLVAASVPRPTGDKDGLDYVLLRVTGSPGSEPIGGDRAEPAAAPRGWITVPRRPFDLVPGSPLFILHYANGHPLQVAVSTEGMIGMDPTASMLQYRAQMGPGSSGAPCFDANWELIAMHEASQSGVSQGQPISAIVRHLETLGMAELLDRRLV